MRVFWKLSVKILVLCEIATHGCMLPHSIYSECPTGGTHTPEALCVAVCVRTYTFRIRYEDSTTPGHTHQSFMTTKKRMQIINT